MKIENAKLRREIALTKWCEMPKCGMAGIHTHHEPTEGSAGLETRLTLIRLCLECHDKRHGGITACNTKGKIIEAVCRREKCSVEDREAVVFLLKRAPKEADRGWFMAEVWHDWPPSAAVLLDKTLTEAGR